ncbi:McrB family protein [Cellulosimicrobium sp. AB352]|uniref:McrB family protein n=1 Tax=Cellulosimicrobium sp. AB352 TaxID=3413281 RepID=UPI003C1AE5B4
MPIALKEDLRLLTADQLGIGSIAAAGTSHASTALDAPRLASDDPEVDQIRHLLQIFGGVILSGPPGTSKSFLAAEAARHLTDNDPARQAYVQFHASYQFEDFMEGFRPDPKNVGTFVQHDGVFLRMLDKAAKSPDKTYVLVIDELSRADVGRVFGEALTYIEKSKRHLQFQLPSGRVMVIPHNLYVIATMNPLDRGVDEVDAAFERRFAKIAMDPDEGKLAAIVSDNLHPVTRDRLLAWFRMVNGRAQGNPAAAVGHAYFAGVGDEDGLQEVWDYQLRYLIDRAFQFDREAHKDVVAGWHRIFSEIRTEDESAADAVLDALVEQA